MNYIAILVAAIASFVLGGLWYGPVFGKTWMKLEGFTPESMRAMPLSAKQAMVFGFINTVVGTAVLSWLIGALGITTIAAAINPIFCVWLGFVATNSIGDWLWKGKSFKLFLFVGAYQIISMAIATAILIAMM